MDGFTADKVDEKQEGEGVKPDRLSAR